MTNTLVWRPPMQDVSTNNGAVLTRTDIAYSPDPASDYDSVPEGEKARATFSGGDGLTVKDAVIVTATSEEARIRAAYIWSREHYPGSHLQYEGSDNDDVDGGREFLEIKIAAADRNSHTLFFDITSCSGQ